MPTQTIKSEITGTIWKIHVKPGDAISVGDELMILESMKMELPVETDCSGTIKAVLVKEEDRVVEDQPLVSISL